MLLSLMLQPSHGLELKRSVNFLSGALKQRRTNAISRRQVIKLANKTISATGEPKIKAKFESNKRISGPAERRAVCCKRMFFVVFDGVDIFLL